MMQCPKCHVQIGGKFRHCPLCQNELTGEAGELYFPPVQAIRKQSLLYRIQLFVSVAAFLISGLLDYGIGLHGSVHWSNIAAVGIVVAEIIIWRLVRHHKIQLHYYILHISVGALILLLVIAYYLHFWQLFISILMPSAVMLILGVLFGFGIADKKKNILVWQLFLIPAGMLLSSVMLLQELTFPLLWQISLVLCLLMLAWLLIFDWDRVVTELQKRLHM